MFMGHNPCQDPPSALNWGCMGPISGYLGPIRGQLEGLCI